MTPAGTSRPNTWRARPNWIAARVRLRDRWWFYAVALVLVFFLFTHQRDDTTCHHTVKIYGLLEIQLGCDTHSIHGLADDPAKIYTEFHNWKGRPVYLTYGLLTGQALMPFVKPVWHVLVKPWTQVKAMMDDFSRYIHWHVAFILLNIAFVFYAVRLGLRMSEVPISSAAAVALAMALSSLELIQASVFAFHTNIFNVAAALGAAAYASLGISARFQSPGQVALLGLIVGAAILVYPSIAIAGPAYLMGNLYGLWRWSDQMPSAKAIALRYGVFVLGMAFLPVGWNQLNAHVFHSDVYLAIQAGHFIWLLEAFREGHLLSTLVERFGEFYQSLQRNLGYEFLMSVAAMAVLAVRGGKAFWSSLKAPIVFCLVIAALGVLSFNFLQGAYVYRLQVCVLLLAYILIARTAWTLKFEKSGAAMLFAIAGYQLVDAALHTARV